jgi:hypothetical protein
MLLGQAIYEQKLMVANSVGILTHRYKWHQNFDGSYIRRQDDTTIFYFNR